jgi:RNA polymerase sigma-70 factor (sigma-E family)
MQAEAEQECADYLAARLPRLHRIAYLLCGDGHRAEDIAQSTAVAIYTNWKRVRAADNTDAYVHRMLVREYLNQRRLSWARVLLTDRMPERVAPTGASVEDRVAVLAALSALPKRQRAAVVLRYFSDLSVQDTAAALGCSEGTVKSQTARGLATLREFLTKPSRRPAGVRPGETLIRNGVEA